jgi:hypothetical protein
MNCIQNIRNQSAPPAGISSGQDLHRVSGHKVPFAKSSLAILMVIIISGTAFAAGPDETIKLVASGIQSGSAAEVSRYFNTMVDLTLPGSDETYSKTQAEQVLKAFFSKNPVKSFKISKQGSSPDGSSYCIGTLEAGNKTFRVYYLIRLSGSQHLLQQLQIQVNN